MNFCNFFSLYQMKIVKNGPIFELTRFVHTDERNTNEKENEAVAKQRCAEKHHSECLDGRKKETTF